MKQYFMEGIDEPLEFGDILGFDIVKEGDDGKSITKHVECKLTEDTLPFLLDLDVISEKEVKDKPSVEDTLGINPDSQDEDNDTDGGDEEDEDDVYFKALENVIGSLVDTVSDNTKTLIDLQDKVDILEDEVAKLKSTTKSTTIHREYSYNSNTPLRTPVNIF